MADHGEDGEANRGEDGEANRGEDGEADRGLDAGQRPGPSRDAGNETTGSSKDEIIRYHGLEGVPPLAERLHLDYGKLSEADEATLDDIYLHHSCWTSPNHDSKDGSKVTAS